MTSTKTAEENQIELFEYAYQKVMHEPELKRKRLMHELGDLFDSQAAVIYALNKEGLREEVDKLFEK